VSEIEDQGDAQQCHQAHQESCDQPAKVVAQKEVQRPPNDAPTFARLDQEPTGLLDQVKRQCLQTDEGQLEAQQRTPAPRGGLVHEVSQPQ